MISRKLAFATSLPNAQWFATTQWGLVVSAGESSPAAMEAMSNLCQAYWRPLYCFARRRGHSPHDAQDLTQEFFSRLMEANYLHRADPQKGRFRSFLLGAFKNFLADEFDRSSAARRGGGAHVISLDSEEAESLLENDSALQMSPDDTYDRQWVLAILERSLVALRKEFEAAGRIEVFNAIKDCLVDDKPPGSYLDKAARLGVSANSLAVSVHRMRKRYRELVRAEISATVSSPSDVGPEMNTLLAALANK
jgi:RNA polymerase sigma factor (sigma-70 family)